MFRLKFSNKKFVLVTSKSSTMFRLLCTMMHYIVTDFSNHYGFFKVFRSVYFQMKRQWRDKNVELQIVDNEKYFKRMFSHYI